MEKKTQSLKSVSLETVQQIHGETMEHWWTLISRVVKI